ncbi:mucin-2-like isoform X2 [Ambystoma mexicanum]
MAARGAQTRLPRANARIPPPLRRMSLPNLKDVPLGAPRASCQIQPSRPALKDKGNLPQESLRRPQRQEKLDSRKSDIGAIVQRLSASAKSSLPGNLKPRRNSTGAIVKNLSSHFQSQKMEPTKRSKLPLDSTWICRNSDCMGKAEDSLASNEFSTVASEGGTSACAWSTTFVVLDDDGNEVFPDSLSPKGQCGVQDKNGGLKEEVPAIANALLTSGDLLANMEPSQSSSSDLLLLPDASHVTPVSRYFPDCQLANPSHEKGLNAGNPVSASKYFSTPLAGAKSKGKVHLTPVMEVELELSTTEANSAAKHKPCSLQMENGCVRALNPDLLQDKALLPEEVPPNATRNTTINTPLYQSFFALECLAIANQLAGGMSRHQSPAYNAGTQSAKRKRAIFDWSTIESEPLPYDSSPMRSMLFHEAATVIRSLESTPSHTDQSLFGESILDLENMDLQLVDLRETEPKLLSTVKEAAGGEPSGLSKVSIVSNDTFRGLKDLSSFEGIDVLEAAPDGSTSDHGLHDSEEVCETKALGDRGLNCTVELQGPAAPRALMCGSNGLLNATVTRSPKTVKTQLIQETESNVPVTMYLDAHLGGCQDLNQTVTKSLKTAMNKTQELFITKLDVGALSPYGKSEPKVLPLLNTTQEIVQVSHLDPPERNMQGVVNITQDILPERDPANVTKERIHVGNTTRYLEVKNQDISDPQNSVNANATHDIDMLKTEAKLENLIKTIDQQEDDLGLSDARPEMDLVANLMEEVVQNETELEQDVVQSEARQAKDLENSLTKNDQVLPDALELPYTVNASTVKVEARSRQRAVVLSSSAENSIVEPAEHSRRSIELPHNDSLFSLSFVTSTPLPGALLFQFIKGSCSDTDASGLQNFPNLSISSVPEEANGDLAEEKHSKSTVSKKDLNRTTMKSFKSSAGYTTKLLNMPPPANSVHRSSSSRTTLQSGLPTARRTLALTSTGEKAKVSRENTIKAPTGGRGLPIMSKTSSKISLGSSKTHLLKPGASTNAKSPATSPTSVPVEVEAATLPVDGDQLSKIGETSPSTHCKPAQITFQAAGTVSTKQTSTSKTPSASRSLYKFTGNPRSRTSMGPPQTSDSRLSLGGPRAPDSKLPVGGTRPTDVGACLQTPRATGSKMSIRMPRPADGRMSFAAPRATNIRMAVSTPGISESRITFATPRATEGRMSLGEPRPSSIRIPHGGLRQPACRLPATPVANDGKVYAPSTKESVNSVLPDNRPCLGGPQGSLVTSIPNNGLMLGELRPQFENKSSSSFGLRPPNAGVAKNGHATVSKPGLHHSKSPTHESGCIKQGDNHSAEGSSHPIDDVPVSKRKLSSVPVPRSALSSRLKPPSKSKTPNWDPSPKRARLVAPNLNPVNTSSAANELGPNLDGTYAAPPPAPDTPRPGQRTKNGQLISEKPNAVSEAPTKVMANMEDPSTRPLSGHKTPEPKSVCNAVVAMEEPRGAIPESVTKSISKASMHRPQSLLKPLHTIEVQSYELESSCKTHAPSIKEPRSAIELIHKVPVAIDEQRNCPELTSLIPATIEQPCPSPGTLKVNTVAMEQPRSGTPAANKALCAGSDSMHKTPATVAEPGVVSANKTHDSIEESNTGSVTMNKTFNAVERQSTGSETINKTYDAGEESGVGSGTVNKTHDVIEEQGDESKSINKTYDAMDVSGARSETINTTHNAMEEPGIATGTNETTCNAKELESITKIITLNALEEPGIESKTTSTTHNPMVEPGIDSDDSSKAMHDPVVIGLETINQTKATGKEPCTGADSDTTSATVGEPMVTPESVHKTSATVGVTMARLESNCKTPTTLEELCPWSGPIHLTPSASEELTTPPIESQTFATAREPSNTRVAMNTTPATVVKPRNDSGSFYITPPTSKKLWPHPDSIYNTPFPVGKLRTDLQPFFDTPANFDTLNQAHYTIGLLHTNFPTSNNPSAVLPTNTTPQVRKSINAPESIMKTSATVEKRTGMESIPETTLIALNPEMGPEIQQTTVSSCKPTALQTPDFMRKSPLKASNPNIDRYTVCRANFNMEEPKTEMDAFHITPRNMEEAQTEGDKIQKAVFILETSMQPVTTSTTQNSFSPLTCSTVDSTTSSEIRTDSRNETVNNRHPVNTKEPAETQESCEGCTDPADLSCEQQEPVAIEGCTQTTFENHSPSQDSEHLWHGRTNPQLDQELAEVKRELAVRDFQCELYLLKLKTLEAQCQEYKQKLHFLEARFGCQDVDLGRCQSPLQDGQHPPENLSEVAECPLACPSEDRGSTSAICVQEGEALPEEDLKRIQLSAHPEGGSQQILLMAKEADDSLL